mgnify:CR=1 FL=1
MKKSIGFPILNSIISKIQDTNYKTLTVMIDDEYEDSVIGTPQGGNKVD